MKSDWINRWKGQTVICIASGPSLTQDDCTTALESGHPAIVTNTTFRLCPWADVLFGFDSAWWREYRAEVDATFKGAKLTLSSGNIGIESLYREGWFFRGCGNSGGAAISLAVAGGAKRVVLLGYDCQKTGGKVHWHGDHPKKMSNAKSIAKWPEQFAAVAKLAKKAGTEVVNCSRETALTCFERMELSEAL